MYFIMLNNGLIIAATYLIFKWDTTPIITCVHATIRRAPHIKIQTPILFLFPDLMVYIIKH